MLMLALILKSLGYVVRKKKSMQIFVSIKEMEIQTGTNILTKCFIMRDIKLKGQMLGLIVLDLY